MIEHENVNHLLTVRKYLQKDMDYSQGGSIALKHQQFVINIKDNGNNQKIEEVKGKTDVV